MHQNRVRRRAAARRDSQRTHETPWQHFRWSPALKGFPSPRSLASRPVSTEILGTITELTCSTIYVFAESRISGGPFLLFRSDRTRSFSLRSPYREVPKSARCDGRQRQSS